MKTLIVYFSLDGNTKWMAQKIQERLPHATLHKIELAKKPLSWRLFRTMVYGFKTTFYKEMAIKSSSLDLAAYNTVIIGGPVWMGSVPPPLRAFINQYPLNDKAVAAFCSMGKEPSHFFNRLRSYLGINSFKATLALVEPLQNLQVENLVEIDEFVEQINKTVKLTVINA